MTTRRWEQDADRPQGAGRLEPGDEDAGIGEARRRFGGIDVGSTLAGMLAALALVVLLGGILGAAIGAIGFQVGLKGNQPELSIAGLVAGLVTLFVAFLFGGWVAGRMARYDGGRNGLMTAVWAILIAAILAGLGAWLGTKYDVMQRVGLPQWFSRDTLTVGAIASGLLAVALMLLGGWLGGRLGERYHRGADSVIASTRRGAIARPAGEVVVRERPIGAQDPEPRTVRTGTVERRTVDPGYGESRRDGR